MYKSMKYLRVKHHMLKKIQFHWVFENVKIIELDLFRKVLGH